MNPIAIRLLNQQLIAPQFNNPTEVVYYMVGCGNANKQTVTQSIQEGF